MMASKMKMTMNHAQGGEGHWVQESGGFQEHDDYYDVVKKKMVLGQDQQWSKYVSSFECCISHYLV